MNDKQITAEQVIEAAESCRKACYAAAVSVLEKAESDGLIFGNGHHAAQKVADAAYWDVLERSRTTIKISYKGPGQIEFLYNTYNKEITQLRGSPPPLPFSKLALETYVESGWTKEIWKK